MADIVTLTPNPAVDLSTATERIVPVMKMRCERPRRHPGGGGVNVARMVRRLGGNVEAILPVGGFTGQLLRRLIDDEGVASRVVEVEAETREDFAVSEQTTAKQYRFVLPGLPLHEAEWRACLDALAATKPPPKFVVGSGSLPPGVPDDFYGQAARIARRLGARFALDTSGAPLKAALDLGVYLIKPNLREMCELAGVQLAGSRDWIAAARQYITAGKVEVVALSLGHRGAYLVTRDLALHAQPLPIQPVSAVGAGDSFLGAMVYALAKGDDLTVAFRLAAASGAAALIHEGTELAQPADVYRLSAQVVIAPI